MISIEKLNEINRLRQEIESHGKIPLEILKKINYKLRLEWNYTSNSMEGNTLTRDETRSVMVNNIEINGKPIKDLIEMKGHDEIISKIMKIGKGEMNLSESRIKEIHKAIMYEDDPEKASQIGKWKTKHNEIINYKGEKFSFTPPYEVQDKMHDLINWLNTEKEKIDHGFKNALHPIEIAFKFHLDYVTIHPFCDGNGRTARIFTNLILISYGYPPLYIKSDKGESIEKDQYGNYIGDIQCYGGSPDLFYDFMAGLLIRSLKIALDAIDGKEIEETDDVDKEIDLLKKQLKGNELHTSERNIDLVNQTFWDFVFPFFERAILELTKQFDEMFADRRIVIQIHGLPKDYRMKLSRFNRFIPEENQIKQRLSDDYILRETEMNLYWEGLKHSSTGQFNLYVGLDVSFENDFIVFNDKESLHSNRTRVIDQFGYSIPEETQKMLINEMKKDALFKIRNFSGLQ